MNAMPLAQPRPLMDMLGARWMVDAKTSGIAWDCKTPTVAFGLSDGSLAVAGLAWDGGPSVRTREGGGAELVPPSAPPPAVARIPVFEGACVALAADADGGFLAGGEDGQLARVQPNGVIDTLARFPGMPASYVAAGPGGWRAGAAGHFLIRLGGASRSIELPNAPTSLAVAPDGSSVAIGHAGGVTLWAGGDTPRRRKAEGIHSDLAWSPDGKRLVSSTREGDVFLWDGGKGEAQKIDQGRFARRSIAFTADGRRLVTSGGGGVACRNMADLTLETCGIGSRDAVLHVACHPRRPLIAAGYANGAVLICRPGTMEVVFVRGAGGGAIDALAWSPDGEALAYGAGGREIGLSILPGLLFRQEDAATP